MAGLTNVTAPADTVDTSADTAATTVAPLTNKPVAAKGPYSLGTPTGNVGVDPQLLANMEQLIQEREAKKTSFMENLKDANAWWSGGVAGPGEALRARAKEREEQDATTFGMKRDLAQNKIAAEQAKVDMASLRKAIRGTGGAAGGAGTPPKLIADEIDRLIDAGRGEEAKARYKEWLTTESGNISKSTYGAAENTQQPTFIQGIGSIQLNSNQARTYEQTGELPVTISKDIRDKARDIWTQNKPQTQGTLPHTKPLEKIGAPTEAPISAPSATTVGGNAVQIATSLNIPIISGDRSNAKQKEIWDESVAAGRPGRTASGNPIAKPGTSKHETGNAIDVNPAEFTEEDARKLVKAGFKQRQDDKNHWELSPATTVPLPQQKAELQIKANAPAPTAVPSTAKPIVPVAAAPAAKPASAEKPLPFPDPINPAQEKINQDEQARRAAIPSEAAKQEAVTAATETGKQLTELQTSSDVAGSTIAAADRVIKIADDPKLSKVMGWMHGGDTKATWLGAAPKFAASLVGQGENFENTAKTLAFSGDKDLLAADERLKIDATQLGIKYTSDMFKGARLGIGLEKLGLQGKGVSTDYLPQVNKLYATLAKDAAEFEIKKNTAFKQWKGGDPAKTYGDFLGSPGYEQMIKEERALLLSRYPGITVDILDKPEAAGHKTTKSGNKYKIVD